MLAALPLVVVPGQPGSFPIVDSQDPLNSTAAVTEFLYNEGQSPDSLTWDFSIHANIAGTRVDVDSPYVPFIKSLLAHGYTEGKDLFVAVADWRLAAAPTDGVADGQLTGLTTAQLTDNTFEYGVDYLAYAIRKASQAWANDHGGVAPPAVNVISHSYGYFLTRAYLASPDYGSPDLPPINDFISMGGANEGVSIAYNWLNNNYVGPGSDPNQGGLYPILNLVYQDVAAGLATVSRPNQPPITADSIMNAQGQPDPEIFVRQYIPAFRDIMATYKFLDGKSINRNPAFRNNLLLDVNGGDDPNQFASLVGHVWDVYGATKTTPTTVSAKLGRGGKVLPVGQDIFASHPVRTVPGQTWFRNNLRRYRGDTLIPPPSAVSTFRGDPRITLVPLGVTHSGMLTNRRVQKRIRGLLEMV
ncbi:hypothetical protein V5E97_00320 [Singulisphaera sp. Ch08]|uniref:Lipase n=1 Tax=Singulisphaera sp. Ch08 TaxID=3120278 RepID=A0AAU7CGB2_9BACT